MSDAATDLPMVHAENPERTGTICGLLYGMPGWLARRESVVTDPEELEDVTCAQCRGYNGRAGSSCCAEHAAADRDHKPVVTEDMQENCDRDGCGLAVTPLGDRHGFLDPRDCAAVTPAAEPQTVQPWVLNLTVELGADPPMPEYLVRGVLAKLEAEARKVGHVAESRYRLGRGGENVETVVFHWSRKHGDCYDCGRPAAFLVPDAYGIGRPIEDHHKRCAVCAANDAVDGERVVRIAPEEYDALPVPDGPDVFTVQVGTREVARFERNDVVLVTVCRSQDRSPLFGIDLGMNVGMVGWWDETEGREDAEWVEVLPLSLNGTGPAT